MALGNLKIEESVHCPYAIAVITVNKRVLDTKVLLLPKSQKSGRRSINPSSSTPPSPHRVEGYCDDLTLIFSMRSCSEHAETLAVLDRRCHDLDLRLKPQKCISLAFNGKQVDRSVTFPLSAGNTRNIVDQPTKFLGTWISH